MASAALGLGTQGLTSDWRIAGASLTLTGLAMGWLVANVSTTTIALVDEHERGAALGIVRALSALATLLGISQPLQTALGIKGIFLIGRDPVRTGDGGAGDGRAATAPGGARKVRVFCGCRPVMQEVLNRVCE
jgi:hypothetical protein